MQESYREVLRWLYSAQAAGVKLSLENIRQLLEALGNPHRELSCIHVAGTNGKGSVCAMLDAVARAAGLRTGLYTSPHLVEFNERIRVAGRPIPDHAILNHLGTIRRTIAKSQCSPTFFEITTALAFLYFLEERVDLVILETGLGGRLDATNLVTPLVSVLTSIDLDHQRILGDSRAKIAREKAGIIKPNVPIVSIEQTPDVKEVIDEVAAANNAPVTYTSKPVLDVPIALAGSHQRMNAALVEDTFAAAKLPISRKAFTAGLSTVFWPGRFQVLDSQLTLDGAHNTSASERLVQTWQECRPGASPTVIFGGLRDKELHKMLAVLTRIGTTFFLVPVKNPRGQDPREIQLPPGISASFFSSVEEALTAARALSDPILVTGSLFLVGEVLALTDPAFGRYQESHQ
ncbi:MAG: bifunctional folylpolyglutamate synthase/dihydrofolate synthase [Verrucomicrobia bacterium]|nr:bifunctional folylpolyglutamate synthase/dihydrofolate synthase [Verrucomicrobiota bacterium]